MLRKIRRNTEIPRILFNFFLGKRNLSIAKKKQIFRLPIFSVNLIWDELFTQNENNQENS